MTHEELCEATARKYVQTFALWEVKGKGVLQPLLMMNQTSRVAVAKNTVIGS